MIVPTCIIRGVPLTFGSADFILPAKLRMDHPNRGILAFLGRTKIDRSDPNLVSKADTEAWKKWVDVDDVRLLRNLDAYPRAWVVHRGRLLKPIQGSISLKWKGPAGLDFLSEPRALWHTPDTPAHHPRQMAWIETDDFPAVSRFLSQAQTDATESVTVIPSRNPQRVELTVALKSPGIVVLAETYYPGWTLSIDGRPPTLARQSDHVAARR